MVDSTTCKAAEASKGAGAYAHVPQGINIFGVFGGCPLVIGAKERLVAIGLQLHPRPRVSALPVVKTDAAQAGVGGSIGVVDQQAVVAGAGGSETGFNVLETNKLTRGTKKPLLGLLSSKILLGFGFLVPKPYCPRRSSGK